MIDFGCGLAGNKFLLDTKWPNKAKITTWNYTKVATRQS